MNHDFEKRLDKTTLIWIAILIDLVVIFVGAGIMTNTVDEQASSPWRTLTAPPAEATHIVYAGPFEIWIEASTGKLYKLDIDRANCLKTKECSSEEWVSVNGAPDYIPNSRAFMYATDCSAINEEKIPPLPSKNIRECIRAEWNPEVVNISYFVLQSDGTVQYWFKENWIGNSAGNYFTSASILALIVFLVIGGIYLFVPETKKDTQET